MLERLPTPWGLVRSGVAPDHPKIKSVTRVYEKTAEHPRFRWYGNVDVGRDVSRAELLERYDAIVYAVGAESGRPLDVPGADLPGVAPATHFVGWYNGHPDHRDHDFDLSVEHAVVIGNGNVAVDVARMLSLSHDELRTTDIADHALDALRESRVKQRHAARPARPRAGRVHDARAPRARRARVARTSWSTPPISRWTLTAVAALEDERVTHDEAQHRGAAGLRRPRPRRAQAADDRAALPALPGGDRRRRPRRGRRRGRQRARPARGRDARRTPDGRDGDAAGGPGAQLDRLPRTARHGAAVRRRSRPDPQSRGPDRRPRARVRHGLDQARSERDHRHEQEVRAGDHPGPAGRPRRLARRAPLGAGHGRLAARASATARDGRALGLDRRP